MRRLRLLINFDRTWTAEDAVSNTTHAANASLIVAQLRAGPLYHTSTGLGADRWSSWRPICRTLHAFIIFVGISIFIRWQIRIVLRIPSNWGYIFSQAFPEGHPGFDPVIQAGPQPAWE